MALEYELTINCDYELSMNVLYILVDNEDNNYRIANVNKKGSFKHNFPLKNFNPNDISTDIEAIQYLEFDWELTVKKMIYDNWVATSNNILDIS
jgi:hypothetical protein